MYHRNAGLFGFWFRPSGIHNLTNAIHYWGGWGVRGVFVLEFIAISYFIFSAETEFILPHVSKMHTDIDKTSIILLFSKPNEHP